ncbi:MAG: hypothetical protein BAA00_07455 [Parageobacillus thermoglucosidasius]|nr:MAG: hypothetical protein BAA00_07455 [Parageobacillus thermoglucosidasius]
MPNTLDLKKSINASISCYNNIKQEVELLMTMPGVKKRNRRRRDCRDGNRYERTRNTGARRLMDRIDPQQP